MAELKPLKITIEGVDKVLKSTQQIQKELNEVKRLAKEKNNITLNDTQAREVLRNLKKEAQDAEASLQSIDNNVKFANFKAAMKSISGELVNIATTAATSGKSASENIKDVGNSIAGIASNFGIVGAAAGALITILTPLVASFFELSKAEQAVENVSKSYAETIAKESGLLASNITILKDSTSSYEDKEKAIESLKEQFPGYFANLTVEGATIEELNKIYALGNLLIKERAASTAINAEKQVAETAIIQQQLEFNRELISFKKELIDLGFTEEQAIEAVTKAKRGDFKISTNGIAATNKLANAIKNMRNRYFEAKNAIDENRQAISELNDISANFALSEEERNALARGRGEEGMRLHQEKMRQYREEQAAIRKTGEEGMKADSERRAREAKEKAEKAKAAAKTAKDKKDANEKVDLKPLSDNVDQAIIDLNASIADPTTSIESLNDELGRVNVLIDNYLNSLGDLSAEAKIAADEIAALGKELSANATTEFEAAKKRQKELTNVLDLISKGYTQDRLGNLILGDPSQTQADLARIKTLGKAIADLALQGKITPEEARQRFKDAGIRLGFVEGQEKIIADVAKRNYDVKKRISELNRTIEKESAEEELKIRDGLNKQRLDAEKKIAERQRLAIENIYKRVSEQTGQTGAAELAIGKQKFDKFVDDIENSYQDKLKAVTEKNKGALADANSLVPNLFKFDDDAIIINEKAYVAALATLSNEDATAAANAIQLAKETNRELSAINIQKNAEIFNANIEYINKISQSYKTLNESELRELRTYLERQRILTEDAGEKTFNVISEDVKNRRGLGQKQSEDELKRIENERQKSLLIAESFYQAEYQLQLAEDEKAIELAKANGADVTIFEEELVNKRLKLEIQKEKGILKINNDYAALIDKTQTKRVDNYSKYYAQIVKDLQGFGNALVDLFNQQSQNFIDTLNEDLTILEQRQTDVLNNISSLEDDLEGKRSGRREAVLQALEQQKEIEKAIALEKLALMERIEKEEIKMRKRQQAASIANAVINGALAITNILAQPSIIPEPANSIFKAVQIGLSVGTTAAQVATIASQKFAKGGFTGSGGQRDETGHKVAGVVHNDEWVAPKWMVESPKFGSVINQLENARTKGFANGGFTSPDFNSLSQSVTGNSTAKLESMIKSYMDSTMQLSNRPIFVSATEVRNVNTTSNRRKASVTL